MSETSLILDAASERTASRLSPELQTFVRTPEFKAWFGDWEHDAENSSRMVDENGEPALVYFGGPSGITRLSGDKRNRTGSSQLGFYFTTRRNNARFYAQTLRDLDTDAIVPSSLYSAFLNVRSPYIKQTGDGVRTESVSEIPEGYDGLVAKGGQYEIVAFDPDQVAFVDEELVNVV